VAGTNLRTDIVDPLVPEHPAARWTPLARWAAALTLVLGTGLQAAAWVVDVQPSYRATLDAAVQNPARSAVVELLLALAVPFLVWGFGVYAVLGRRRSPRLAWAGGILTTGGLILLGSHLGSEMVQVQLAADGVLSPAAVARLADRASLGATVVGFGFLGCILVGIPLTAVSLWRSRAVPRLAALFLACFLAVDLAGQGVAAHVIAFVAASWIALTLIRVRPPRGLASQGSAW
jgi:hypothetical protein